MPIAVTCPACSGTFSVKDEYAGKRAKCPKCAEPLTVPAATPPAPPAPPVAAGPVLAARPVVASRPKPAPVDEDDDTPATPRRKRGGDADEEPVRPKSRRGVDSDDEDEKPKRKRGASSDDDEEKPKSRRAKSEDEKSGDDDTPKRKRRRGDDDDEPKKKSPLLLILGIVGGVFLLCGGVCTGGYFIALKPAMDKAKANNDEKEKEIEKMLGQEFSKAAKEGSGQPKPNVPAPAAAINVTALALTAEYEQDQAAATAKYEGKKVKITGRVSNITDGAVHLDGTPKGQPALVYLFVKDAKKLPYKAGDWVEGEGTGAGWYNNGGRFYLQVSNCSITPTFGPPDQTPTPPVTSPNTGPSPSPPSTAVAITADALAKEFDADFKAAEAKYKGKDLKVTGVIADIPKDAVSFTFQGGSPPATKAAIVVWISPKFGGWGPIKKMKVGDTVTATGKYDSFIKGKGNTWEVRVTDSTFGK